MRAGGKGNREAIFPVASSRFLASDEVSRPAGCSARTSAKVSVWVVMVLLVSRTLDRVGRPRGRLARAFAGLEVGRFFTMPGVEGSFAVFLMHRPTSGAGGWAAQA